MKKYIIVLLALALVLCAGCQKREAELREEIPASVPEQTAEDTEPPVTEPPVTEAPETEPPATEETVPAPALNLGSALADGTPAILDTLMRGDPADVVGEYDEAHYVIKTDLGYGLVKKELLRLEGESAYTPWTGYAYWEAEVYGSYHLTGAPVLTLKVNTKVEVLEDLGICYVVRVKDTEGFMSKSRLAQWPIAVQGPAAGEAGYGAVQLAAIEQKGEVTGSAVVLADGTEVILGYFHRGEEIPLVAEEGLVENRPGYAAIYLEGLYAYVPRELVVTEQTPAYSAWDGFSRWNGMIFDNLYLQGDPVVTLNTNDRLHVVAEFEKCYLVEANGVTGFMSKDLVRRTKITGDSGNTGGDSIDIPDDSAEWSPPAL